MKNPFRRKPATPPALPEPTTEPELPVITYGYWGHEQGTGLYDDDYGIMR